MQMTQVKNKRADSQAGFTLLETTVAMVLMAIVGLGIAGLFAYAASSTSNAADREMASAVAQQQMEQLRSLAFTDSSLAATSSTGVNTTVTRLGRTYSVNTIIADSVVVNSAATLKTITIKVTPQSSSAPWSSNVNTIFGSVTLVSTRSSLLAGPNRSF
jgi:prepilin-type N-terminal cleavage/methylation domain-containing protein